MTMVQNFVDVYPHGHIYGGHPFCISIHIFIDDIYDVSMCLRMAHMFTKSIILIHLRGLSLWTDSLPYTSLFLKPVNH